MHYDPPPPLTLSDVDGMRRRGEFRFANRVGAYIDVEDGRIAGAGYRGGVLMGLTPITAGPLRVMLPAKANRDIQWQPAIGATEATFVQTAGGRPGFSLLKPTWRWPFLVTKPFTIWTTITLTINVDGSCTQALAGASPFPRHWLYDDAGHLVEKSALTRNQVWARTIFGAHTPWGGEDQTVDVAEPETQLERALADEVMNTTRNTASASCTPTSSCFARVRPVPPWRSSSTASSKCASTATSWATPVPEQSSANEHRSRPVAAPPTCEPQPTPASCGPSRSARSRTSQRSSRRDIIARTPPERPWAPPNRGGLLMVEPVMDQVSGATRTRCAAGRRSWRSVSRRLLLRTVSTAWRSPSTD